MTDAYAHRRAIVLAGCAGSEEVIRSSASGVVVILCMVWLGEGGALRVGISVDIVRADCDAG